MARTVATGPTPGRPMFDAEIFARAFERSEGRAHEQRRAQEAGDALASFAERNGGQGPLEAGLADAEQRRGFLSQLAQLPPHERASLLMSQPALVAALTNAEFTELMSAQQQQQRADQLQGALPQLMGPDATPQQLSQASAAIQIAPDFAAQRLIGQALPEAPTWFQREQVALSRDQFTESTRQFAMSHGLDVQKFQLDAMKAELERGGQVVKNSDDFSQRWQRHASAYTPDVDRADNMIRAAALRTDAADVELSLEFLSMLTGSTVPRGAAGGIIEELSNTGMLDQRLVGILWSSIIQGQKLTDRSRAELVEAGALRAQSQLNRYERERQLFVGMAQDRGFDVVVAVPDLVAGEARARLDDAVREVQRDRQLPALRQTLEPRQEPSRMEGLIQRGKQFLGLEPAQRPEQPAAPAQQEAPAFPTSRVEAEALVGALDDDQLRLMSPEELAELERLLEAE